MEPPGKIHNSLESWCRPSVRVYCQLLSAARIMSVSEIRVENIEKTKYLNKCDLLDNFLKISTSPTEVFSHTHNILVQHVPGIITVKFSFIDVSRAALKPLGIIELEAYQNCEKVLEPLTKDIENIPSYDILITCKNGEKIPAHVSILRGVDRIKLMNTMLIDELEIQRMNALNFSPESILSGNSARV